MSDSVIGLGVVPNVYIDHINLNSKLRVELVMNDYLDSSSWFGSQILESMYVIFCVVAFDNNSQHPDNIIAQNTFEQINNGSITLNEVSPIRGHIDVSRMLCNSGELEGIANDMGDYLYIKDYESRSQSLLIERDNVVVYAMVSSDLSLLDLPVEYKFLDGPLVSEIAKGINEGLSYVFYLPDGSIYSGPYHEHEGTFMVGPIHTDSFHETLTRKTIINYTNVSSGGLL